MRRINLHFDEELDQRTADEARRRNISKAEFVRRCVRSELGDAQTDGSWSGLVGMFDDEPPRGADATPDEVVYEWTA